MAGDVQGAVAGEIPALKFKSDLMDADRQPSRKEIFPVAPYCFLSSKV
jgi:hypothetical protein